MIFGSGRDFNTILGINRELISDVIEQEVLYYKISLENSKSNIYGESVNKVFYQPVKLNCLVERGEQQAGIDDFGPDLNRYNNFRFLKEDLKNVETYPQVGDIILWFEDYYEVDNVIENQHFLGKNPEYTFTEYGDKYGASISMICQCHQTRGDKLGITQQR